MTSNRLRIVKSDGWSWDVLDAVARAQALGMFLAPNGGSHHGWDLSQGADEIMTAALLPEVLAELDRREGK